MLRSTSLRAFRKYSTNPSKPSLQLVAELRKHTEVSISKAREALVESNNNISSALEWLQRDLATSGAKLAAKVEGRTAAEGLVSVCVLGGGTGSHSPGNRRLGDGSICAAMIELNCETDFVARNSLFGQLAADITHTAAFNADITGPESMMMPFELNALHNAPLMSQNNLQAIPTSTVGDSIRDTMAKVGEKIVLKRALGVAQPPLPPPITEFGLRVASYLHGGSPGTNQGRIGSLALIGLRSANLDGLLASEVFCKDLEVLERSLVRQIVGFETRSIHSSDADTASSKESSLYHQPFMMHPDNPAGYEVARFLQDWARKFRMDETGGDGSGGIQVMEFEKWTVGEAFEGQTLP